MDRGETGSPGREIDIFEYLEQARPQQAINLWTDGKGTISDTKDMLIEFAEVERLGYNLFLDIYRNSGENSGK